MAKMIDVDEFIAETMEWLEPLKNSPCKHDRRFAGAVDLFIKEYLAQAPEVKWPEGPAGKMNESK